ncbi:MAG: hypothetical protein IAE78_27130 [Myxococcus sp.]|nr:hypothetical protein [Myxococcus sp.]
MRSLVTLLLLLAPVVGAEPTWQPRRTAVGLGVSGRWTKAVELGGGGRAMTVSGGGPAANVSGSFGWSRGALRLGGLGSYELMFSPEHDLEVTAAGPLRPQTTRGPTVTAAHFFSLGPFVGAQTGGDHLVGFADAALLVDLLAAELEGDGLRLGLRFVPVARVGVSIDMGFASLELWLFGSALVAPRAGLVLALGF